MASPLHRYGWLIACGLALALVVTRTVFTPAVAGAATTVTVSGSVHDANGDPMPQVLLISDWGTFSGTSTDSNGNFSFETDPSHDQLDLLVFFDDHGTPIACCTSDALALSARTTIDTSGATNLNITIPARVLHTASVIDASGHPLVGVALDAAVVGALNSLGTAQQWATTAQTRWTSSNPSLCTTDAIGSCTFRTFATFLDALHPGTVSVKSGQTASDHPSGNLSGSAPLTSPTTTIVATAAQPELLVQGTVRDADGAVVAGARIRTSAGSTATSDSDGMYAVYVLAGTTTIGAYAAIDPMTGELTPPPPSAGATDLDRPCFHLLVGSGGGLAPCEIVGTTVRSAIVADTSVDVTLPALAAHPIHVENVNGAAIADANVILSGGIQHHEAVDADGIVTRQIFSAGWAELPWNTCQTDSSGDCDLHALAQVPDASLSAWAFKGLAFGTDGSMSVDAYGVADHLSDGITTIRTAFWTAASQGTNSGEVTIAATEPDSENPSGRALTDVSISPAPALPTGSVSPSGELSYTVADVPVGGTQDVVIALPPGSAPTAVYKNTASGLVDVSSIASITGDTIVMHLTDGGLGDEDGIADGVIVDPVIPVRSAPATATVSATLTRTSPIYGQRNVLKTTAVITSNAKRANGGTITVTDEGSTIGTCTASRAGTCNLTLPTLAAGHHTLTVSYDGTDGSGTRTVDVTVAQATTRTIIRGPSSANTGSAVTFTVRTWTLAPGRGVPTGTVTFLDGSTPLGTVGIDSGGYASITTSEIPFGGHTINAIYNGDADHTTSSKGRTIAIK